MLALLEFNSAHIDFLIHVPSRIGFRDRNGICNSIIVHQQHEARRFGSRSHIRLDKVLGVGGHVHGVFQPFASLRITNGKAFAILSCRGIGAFQPDNIHTIFTVGISLVGNILVAVRNALAAFVVIFGLHQCGEHEGILERSLRNRVREISQRDVRNLVGKILEFALEACSGRNRLDIATVVAFCKLARLITADTTRSIPVRVILNSKAARAFIEVNRQNPIVRPLGGTVIV